MKEGQLAEIWRIKPGLKGLSAHLVLMITRAY